MNRNKSSIRQQISTDKQSNTNSKNGLGRNKVQRIRHFPGKPGAPLHESSSSEASEDEASEEVDEEQDEEPEESGVVADEARPKLAFKPLTVKPKALPVEEELESSEGEYVTDEEEEEEGVEHIKSTAPSISSTSAKSQKDTTSEEESDEESSEEESEESSEEEGPVLVKPTFIPKGKRALTTAAATPPPQTNPEARKQETLALAQEDIRQQLALEALRFADGDDAELAQVDDTDDLDVEAERAAWRLRELSRIKRDRDAMVSIEKEREELEQLRESKTEAEREEEAVQQANERKKTQIAAAAFKKESEEGHAKFVPKYHKGAFYQEDSVVKNRDFRGILEDGYKDQSVVPKALQGRDVGLKGRSKYKSLVEQDTSRGADSPWFARGKQRDSDKR